MSRRPRAARWGSNDFGCLTILVHEGLELGESANASRFISTSSPSTAATSYSCLLAVWTEPTSPGFSRPFQIYAALRPCPSQAPSSQHRDPRVLRRPGPLVATACKFWVNVEADFALGPICSRVHPALLRPIHFQAFAAGSGVQLWTMLVVEVRKEKDGLRKESFS